MSTTQAYTYLVNGTIFKAVNEVYISTVGIWFWPIIFIFTEVLVYLKTENTSYLLAYAIIGNAVIGANLPTISHPIFYTTAVFSLFLVLWKIYASKKTE